MKRRLSLVLLLSSAAIFSTSSSCSPAAPATSTTSPISTSSQQTQTTQPMITTSAASTTPVTVPPATTTPVTVPPATSKTNAGSFSYEKLEVLSSYRLLLTAEALGGPAKGFRNKYDATHKPPDKAYQSALSTSRDGAEYILTEECIVIGKAQWVKAYGKSWTTGSSIADGYQTYFSILYLALKNGSLEKIDEATVSGIPAIHYRFLYQTGSTRAKGEVWIANQAGLEPVPLKAVSEQEALDESGAAIDDLRHVNITFEVSEVNAAVTIKAPI